MGPVRQNPIQRTKNCSSKCAYDCTTSVHNTTQNSSDNLPSYIQTSIIAQMLSIGGEGVSIQYEVIVFTVLLTMGGMWQY